MSEILLNSKLAKRERNYGIDILRILSMFMVVLLHVNKFGGLLSHYEINSLGYIYVWGLEAFAICAVNVYAMISGYFLFNSKFKLKRIIQLYVEVLFFKVLSYVLIVFTKGEWNGFGDFIKNLIFNLPLQGEFFWYFKSYFLLFFIYPLLNILIRNMEKRQFVLFFAVMFVIICIFSYYGYDFGFAAGYSFIWLVAMYFIGAYFRKFGLLKMTALKSFSFYLILTVLIIAGLIVNNALPAIQISTSANTLDLKYDTYNYTSFLVVLQAVFIFNSFAKIKIASGFWQKTLLFISPLTFGVYVVHCTEFVKNILKSFVFITEYSVWLIIPFAIGCALSVFIVCAFIEWLKQLIFKHAKIDKLTDITGDFIQNKISAFAEKKSVK